MEKYVCGFMFNQERTHVALINKLRPSWQYNKLNGVGGHIEDGESPEEAMSREFMEEAGVPDTKWERVMEYSVFADKGEDGYWLDLVATVYFFRSFGDLKLITSKTDEKISICNIDEIHSMNVLKKIKFLVPLCLNDDIKIPFKMSGEKDN
jgi:8-oxo-dGTP diphosphatase